MIKYQKKLGNFITMQYTDLDREKFINFLSNADVNFFKAINIDDSLNPIYYGQENQVLILNDRLELCKVIKSYGNCQLAIIDNYQNLIKNLISKEKADLVLDNIFKTFDRPFYFFHVTERYIDGLRDFIKKKTHTKVYEHEVDTYESIQYHVLVKNNYYVPDDEDVLNDEDDDI